MRKHFISTVVVASSNKKNVGKRVPAIINVSLPKNFSKNRRPLNEVVL